MSPQYEIFRGLTRLEPGSILADDETVRMEVVELDSGEAHGPVAHPDSDEVFLFLEGKGEFRVADRVHEFGSPRHAFVPAGTAYELRNTGDSPLTLVRGICPPGPEQGAPALAHSATPGGVTLLQTDRYHRFPDSGLVRGGMWFLDAGDTASYHSHDGAPEVFVFLRGTCDITIEGKTERVGAGDVVYVAPEMKHGLANPGADRLEAWLTVTPNVTPSHTFYDELPDGTWERVTPRLDGRPILPPSP